MIEGIMYDGKHAVEIYIETKLTHGGIDIRARTQQTNKPATVIVLDRDNAGQLIGALETLRLESAIKASENNDST